MKNWKKPEARIEVFEANDVIAACWSINCAIPAESGGVKGYDPFKPGDEGNLHRAEHCGSADGFAFVFDESGTVPKGLLHIKAGSTNNKTALPCTIYTDESFTVVRDISTVQAGELIYFTTVNGRTWHHHGTVQAGNHS